MSNVKVYKPQGGDELVIADDGLLTVEDGGAVDVEDGGVVTVEDGGAVTVEDGGVVTVEDGATLTIAAGATLEIEAGATVTVSEPGVTLIPPVITTADNLSLLATYSGATVVVTGVDKTIDLPAAASKGYFTIILAAAGLSAGTGVIVKPGATEKIIGNGLTPAAGVGVKCAGASDRAGDSITLKSDGTDWYITSVVGTWTAVA